MTTHEISPRTAAGLLVSALAEFDDSQPTTLRELREYITRYVARKMGNSRFSCDFRHGITSQHELIYQLCSTVGANVLADGGEWSAF